MYTHQKALVLVARKLYIHPEWLVSSLKLWEKRQSSGNMCFLDAKKKKDLWHYRITIMLSTDDQQFRGKQSCKKALSLVTSLCESAIKIFEVHSRHSLSTRYFSMVFRNWLHRQRLVVLYPYDHMFMACDASHLKFTGQKFTEGCDAWPDRKIVHEVQDEIFYCFWKGNFHSNWRWIVGSYQAIDRLLGYLVQISS